MAKLRRISATRRERRWPEAHPETTRSDVETVDLRGMEGHSLRLANVTMDSAVMFPTTARRILNADAGRDRRAERVRKKPGRRHVHTAASARVCL